jgi:antitoxin VapB
MDKAKVFWSGRSQAVRLPKEFRLQANEVRIRRQGNSIILEPIVKDWSWLDNLEKGEVDADFLAALDEPVAHQSRPELDSLFEQ